MKNVLSLLGILLVALLGATAIVVADEKGTASFYADRFHGRTTACGHRFDQTKMTAAHKSLPCGTKVKVIRRDTGRSVTVIINDRGPFVKGRIIDLSKIAARKLRMMRRGLAPVRVKVLSKPKKRNVKRKRS